MRTFAYHIDDMVADRPISRDFQLRSSQTGYRPKDLKPLFRGENGFWHDRYNSRGLLRILAGWQDDTDEAGFRFSRRHQKEKRNRFYGYHWSDDHHNHAIRGFKSWKRRCRKKHQWEHHKHSIYELSLPGMGMAYLRLFILDALRCSGNGCFTFNTARRSDLEDTLYEMAEAGEILLEDNYDVLLSHCRVTARLTRKTAPHSVPQ